MAACSAAKRPRPTALEANVTTVTIPGLGSPEGIFVLADGTRLFSSGHTILQLPPSGRLATIAGDPQEEEGALKDGQGIFARFNCPEGLTVDRADNVVVADWENHVHHVEQILARQGFGRRTQSVFSPLAPVLFSFQSFILSMDSKRHVRRGN